MSSFNIDRLTGSSHVGSIFFTINLNCMFSGKENAAPSNSIPSEPPAHSTAAVVLPTSAASLISNCTTTLSPQSTNNDAATCSFVTSCSYPQPMDCSTQNSNSIALPPRTDCNLNEDMLYSCYGSCIFIISVQCHCKIYKPLSIAQ